MKQPEHGHVDIQVFNGDSLIARVEDLRDMDTGGLRVFISQGIRTLSDDQVDADEDDNIHMLCPRWAEVDLQELEKLV